MSSKVKLVVFYCGESSFGVPIESTERIVPAAPLTALPGMSPRIRGCFEWRGETVPVLDGVAALGLTVESLGSQFIIVKVEGRRMALEVDRVDAIVELNESEIDRNLALLGLASDGVVRGIGRVGENLLVVLNPEALCQAA